jgi:hypothetical protein
MRRMGLGILGVVVLLLGTAAPAAAFVPDPGRYRYMDVNAWECTTTTDPCDVYTIYDVYAQTHQDGSTDVCVFVGYVDIPTPTNEHQDFGCNTAPPAFTYDGAFIVGIPNTSVDLYRYYPSGGFVRTVTASAAVSLVGRPDRHTETSTEVSGNCTTRLTARYQMSDIAGTFTVDSLLTAGNNNPISSQVSDYSVKTVCK